ncbi:DUF1989 domain-containing protein [Maribius pontilimi]|uniref:DUF1989 domain-containing protein n=1 Tax=Palleronia pontilimi TaxID=1964209 RepID=A0A934MCS7_9RHOB|nr:DUF1989 domain-containing protein [Palleronia pontilimi]MBJ3762825.1 DUF1989 domain-containing protein [Palleronia pontilimi]
MATPPPDADARRAVKPVICYPADSLPPARGAVPLADAPHTQVQVPPRDARSITVSAGHVLRILCPDGPQVGDLNLFAADNLDERFYSGKTRALHGSHVGVGDRLWSGFPYLRPMATIVADSLHWYGVDAFGGRVHDVIGTRCDPYTAHLLSGQTYHQCCHSNLTRALADHAGLDLRQAERHVHDVLNVFMCTGFDRATGQYFMKSTPARAGDHLDLLAEIDLLAVLSACPGGDCGSEHSSDAAICHPLRMEVFAPRDPVTHEAPRPNGYDRSHGR